MRSRIVIIVLLINRIKTQKEHRVKQKGHYGSQLDKLRLFLAATETVHVDILGIDNCKCVIHLYVFMYFVGNRVTTTLHCRINVQMLRCPYPFIKISNQLQLIRSTL